MLLCTPGIMTADINIYNTISTGVRQHFFYFIDNRYWHLTAQGYLYNTDIIWTDYQSNQAGRYFRSECK